MRALSPCWLGADQSSASGPGCMMQSAVAVAQRLNEAQLRTGEQAVTASHWGRNPPP